jgi:hypothetical protein
LLNHYKDARVHCEVLNIRAETRCPVALDESRFVAIGHSVRCEVRLPACAFSRNLRTQQRAQAAQFRLRGSTPLRVVLTDRRTVRLKGQCSTFRCLSHRARTARIGTHGRDSAS